MKQLVCGNCGGTQFSVAMGIRFCASPDCDAAIPNEVATALEEGLEEVDDDGTA